MPDIGLVQQLLSEGEIPVGIDLPIMVHDARTQQHWCEVDVHEKQLVKVLDPGGEYWPFGQELQLVDLSNEEYWRAGHNAQLVEPAVDEYWPFGQESQLVDPADEEYWPAGQAVHWPIEEE